MLSSRSLRFLFLLLCFLFPLFAQNVSEEQKNRCLYEENKVQCTKQQNEISRFCKEHFDSCDLIYQQEEVLRQGKLTLEAITEAYENNNQEKLFRYSSQMHLILMYPVKVEWIKIETEDLSQRYKNYLQANYQDRTKLVLQKAAKSKERMSRFLSELDFDKVMQEHKKLIAFFYPIEKKNRTLELQKILKDAKGLSKKADAYKEFFTKNPLHIEGIIWLKSEPEESFVVINGFVKKSGERIKNVKIIEIREKEVIFSYKGIHISKKL